MKRDRYGRVTLEHPADYLEFTHAGVHFERVTGLHQASRYEATVRKTGRRYVVTGGHSKRYPWRAWSREQVPTYTPGDFQAGYYQTLVDAAEQLAVFDATMYPTMRVSQPARSAPSEACNASELSHGTDHGRTQSL